MKNMQNFVYLLMIVYSVLFFILATGFMVYNVLIGTFLVNNLLEL